MYIPINEFNVDDVASCVYTWRHRKIQESWSDNVITFDIETVNLYKWPDGSVTGFDYNLKPDKYRTAEKVGYMVVWQMAVDDFLIYGRRWEEVTDLLAQLRKKIGARIIIWIHNLGFEFHFLRNVISDFEIFAREPLKPFRAYSPSLDVEFRCTQILTNQKLENVPEMFHLPSLKAVGKWDYDKIRTPETPLTEDELDYAMSDVIVPRDLIRSLAAEYGHVNRIPMTNTSRLRKKVLALYNNAWFDKVKIAEMNETDPYIYRMLKWAFQGGYTHANADHVGKIMSSVDNADEGSAYPAQIAMRKFPWGRFSRSNVKDVNQLNLKFAYLLHIRFYDVTSKLSNHYISFSRCLKRRGTYNDNGRIVMADMVEMVITDVDLDIIRRAYLIGRIEILEAWCAVYKYLDSRFVRFALDKYKAKTELKGIPEMIRQYTANKVENNSLFGMMVTDVVRDDVIFDNNEWQPIVPDSPEEIREKLQKVADPRKCFLSYAWGVWVTAWARSSLWEIILAPGCDKAILYNDTDSVKFSRRLSNGAVERAIENYNKSVETMMNRAMIWHRFPADLWKPKDNKGRERPLGFFEREEPYDEFRTWGAKKYAVRIGDKIETTVAGVAKTYRGEDGQKHVYLKDLRDFKEGLRWPYKYSGRTTAYYQEHQTPTTVDGYTFTERFGIVVSPTEYTLGITGEFHTFIHAAQADRDHTGSAWLEGCVKGANR